MKKNRNRLIFLLIALIFAGFLALSILGYKDYSGVIEEDILNITKLVSTNIYSEIQIELVKPVFVSLTMANDTFVKQWVKENHEGDIEAITHYLKGIQDKYEYDSTFFVSNVTKNYYHYAGILKQVAEGDSHDVWFYDFINKGIDYELDVDTDQAAGNDLTLFVNCATKDGDEIIGVTGVGVKMSKVQETIKAYQEEFDVEIFLMSPDGTIQVHADENVIEKRNAFDDETLSEKRYEILAGGGSNLKVFKPEEGKDSHYIVSCYVDELNWYLIVHKEADILDELLFTQRVKSSIIFAIAFLLAALITVLIINYYHNKNERFVKTDYLTEINNRNAFDDALRTAILKIENTGRPLTLAVIDIDDFKEMNDVHGHVEGDNILKGVAEYLKSFIRDGDIIARWGGDEFMIIFTCDIENTKKILSRIMKPEGKNNIMAKYGITFSIGMSQYIKGESTKSLIARADKAMYRAKEGGKNQICAQ